MSNLVLLVDSDHNQAKKTCLCLEGCDYEVRMCTRLADTELVLRTCTPSVLVVNMLSNERACAAMPWLRRITEAGIIGYPAPQHDLAVALRLGADDCQTGAISCDELVARTEALLRRIEKWLRRPGKRAGVIHIGELRIDGGRGEVEVNKQPVHLTPTEFRMLEHLASNTDRYVSRDELLIRVCGEYTPGMDEHKTDVHIGRLRAKLRGAGLSDLRIKTVHGRGFRLSP